MIAVFTDGGCYPNPGKGAWAFVVYEREIEIHSDSAAVEQTTNNAMEMTAVVCALEHIRENYPSRSVLIYSDSKYVVNGCNSWRKSWRRNGWTRKCQKTNQIVPVKNQDLWKRIDHMLSQTWARGVAIKWIKGHAGIAGNERADELTNIARAGA